MLGMVEQLIKDGDSDSIPILIDDTVEYFAKDGVTYDTWLRSIGGWVRLCGHTREIDSVKTTVSRFATLESIPICFVPLHSIPFRPVSFHSVPFWARLRIHNRL